MKPIASTMPAVATEDAIKIAGLAFQSHATAAVKLAATSGASMCPMIAQRISSTFVRTAF
jgi:hypothetical protein